MGNATQCGLLVSYFQQFLAAENYKELSLVTAEDTLSTQRIQDAIFLKSGEPEYSLFHDLVDESIKSAIKGIYGKFSTFTTPIVTQSMLQDFKNVFRQMLPVQYHAHQTMMGKPVNLSPDAALTDDQRMMEQLHDRFVLFDFMHLARA